MKSATSLRWRASSRSESWTTRSASVVASSPISLRSARIACCRSVGDALLGGGEHLLDPRLRLAARLFDDLGALGLRLLAQPGGLTPGLGQRLGVLPLGLLQPLLRGLGVVELLLDRRLALRRASW